MLKHTSIAQSGVKNLFMQLVFNNRLLPKQDRKGYWILMRGKNSNRKGVEALTIVKTRCSGFAIPNRNEKDFKSCLSVGRHYKCRPAYECTLT